MGMPGGLEWVIVGLVVVLLFGGKKIPELMKGIGKGIKNFKSEMKEDTTEMASTQEPKKVEKSDETAATETPSETSKQA